MDQDIMQVVGFALMTASVICILGAFVSTFKYSLDGHLLWGFWS
jgi:hypothetical protein